MLYLGVDYKIPVPAVFDSFNRVNSAITMGNAETGQTWGYAGTWGISNNQACLVTAGTLSRSYLTAVANFNMKVTLSVMAAGAGIIYRYSDVDNYWYVVPSVISSAYKIYKKVNGSASEIVPAISLVPANGHIIQVIANGSSIAVNILDGGNNILGTKTISDTHNQTAIILGFYNVNASLDARWNDLHVKQL